MRKPNHNRQVICQSGQCDFSSLKENRRSWAPAAGGLLGNAYNIILYDMQCTTKFETWAAFESYSYGAQGTLIPIPKVKKKSTLLLYKPLALTQMLI